MVYWRMVPLDSFPSLGFGARFRLGFRALGSGFKGFA